MKTSPLLSFLFAVVVVAAGAPAQHIWKVNCAGGPGVDFTDLPPAVAAAAPGDEIRVYYSATAPCPGFQHYTPAVIAKPLRIVGFTVSPAASGPIPTYIGFRGAFLIQGIPAGQQVTLSNVSLGKPNGAAAWGLVAVDCAGAILLEDFIYLCDGTPGAYVHFERCANVVLRGCDIVLGAWPVRVIDSHLLITTTTIYPTDPFPLVSYEQTSEALRLRNSTATIVDSVLWGNDRRANQVLWTERPAVVLETGGRLRLGPGAFLYGGLNGQPYPLDREYSYYSYPLPGNVGVVELDPRGVIDRVPPPTHGPVPVPTDIQATYHDFVVGGQSFHTSVMGPPNGFALLAIGDWQPVPLPTSLGDLAIVPSTATLLDVAPLSASLGWHQWYLTCPIEAAVAHAFCLQAAVLSPAGVLSLTVPSPLTVGWPHGQIP